MKLDISEQFLKNPDGSVAKIEARKYYVTNSKGDMKITEFTNITGSIQVGAVRLKDAYQYTMAEAEFDDKFNQKEMLYAESTADSAQAKVKQSRTK